ncbi:MAG: hypothetical protein V5A88_01530 [Candidatus Thermoplasmatota archaeon]
MYAFSALLIILVILIMLGIFLYFRHRARKKALKKEYGRVPSHTELYFKEYFEEMIDSWDLVRKDEVDEWVGKMDDRIETVSEDIDRLKSNRENIDDQLSAVEKRIEKLEMKDKSGG